MNEKRILDVLGLVKDTYIEEASFKQEEKQATRNRTTILKRTAIAAGLLLIIGTIMGTIENIKMRQVAYADTYNRNALSEYYEDDILTIDTSISSIKENKFLRVAIIIRDYEEGYAKLQSDMDGMTYADIWENFYKINDASLAGEITQEEVHRACEINRRATKELDEQVLQKESEFLKEIGAKDISIQENCTIICTIKKNMLERLSKGKCKYTAVLCTKDETIVNDLNIESFTGEYNVKECVGVPSYSNSFIDADMIKNGKLVIDQNGIDLSIQTNDEKKFLYVDCPYEKNTSLELDEPFVMNIYASGNPKLLRLLYSTNQSYTVTGKNGSSFYIYITQYGIYVDLGLEGIYKF